MNAPMKPRLEQVGTNWYYWTGDWTGVKGPFLTLAEAAQALEKELQDMNGKKNYSNQLTYLVQDEDNI